MYTALDGIACRGNRLFSRRPASFLVSFCADFSNQTQRECFWVKHYAGKVKYTVEGWVERNMDRVPESFSSTLAASTSKVSGEKRSAGGEAIF